MGRLDGKVALISGGAQGQGAAEAKLFVQEGAKVVLGDVLDVAGLTVEAEIRELSGEATYVHLDVTREEDWIAAIEAAVNLHGKLDILVNNAGISGLGTGGGSIVNISSVSGLVGSGGRGYGAYGASNGTVRLLAKATAIQYAREGIRCNSVHPG